jgi:hypothetical protein
VIISNAKTPWEAVANSVGSDTVTEKQPSPLNFRHLEEKDTRRPPRLQMDIPQDIVKS